MLVLSALALLAAAQQPARHLRYHVLLVGVQKPKSSDFVELGAVKTDLAALADALITNWHVPKDDVKIKVAPEETTKLQIVNWTKTLLINPCTGPDDVVYFGYSGHGTQLIDPNKATGLSQAIVASDADNLTADKPSKNAKKGEIDPDTLLTGPEIGALFDQLKGKTSNITLTFDCCHSGLITRGTYRARSAKKNASLERFKASGAKPGTESLSKEIDFNRGLVCLSAASATQEALETADGGLFTRALVKALREPIETGSSPTYDSLFSQLKSNLAEIRPLNFQQDPQIEGPSNRSILGDEYVAPRQTMEVHTAGKDTDGNTRIVMHGGRIYGVKESFLVGLWPNGAVVNSSAKPVWTATVTSVRTDECDLKLSEVSDKLLKGNYGPLKANAQGLVVDGSPDGSIRVATGELPKEIEAALKFSLVSAPMVRVGAPDNDCDFLLTPQKLAGTGSSPKCELIDAKGDMGAGHIVETLNLEGDAAKVAAALSAELQSIARRNAVMALEPTEDISTAVEMRFVPVTMNSTEDMITRIDTASTISDGDKWSRKTLFAIQVRLKPTGVAGPKFAPFIALLNVNPKPAANQKRVDQIWPSPDDKDHPGRIAADPALRQLGVNQGWRYLGVKNNLVTGEKLEQVQPFGVDADLDGVGPELFKLFATDDPEDFGPLVDPATRGLFKGIASDLGRTLGNFAKAQPRTRDAKPKIKRGGSQHWCTASITLNVIPKPSN